MAPAIGLAQPSSACTGSSKCLKVPVCKDCDAHAHMQAVVAVVAVVHQFAAAPTLFESGVLGWYMIEAKPMLVIIHDHHRRAKQDA